MEIRSEADIPSEKQLQSLNAVAGVRIFFTELTHQQQTLEINAQEKGPSRKKQGIEKQPIFNT